MGVIMINDLIKSTNLVSVPSEYTFPAELEDPSILKEKEVPQVTIPVIDFSFLTSGSPDQRSKIMEDLRNACQNWGFFMVMNHGVPGSLKNELMESCKNFFDLSPEEKSVYRGKHEFDPRDLDHGTPLVRGTDYMLDHNIILLDHGADFNPAVGSVSFWRDQLKVFVHPIFDPPPKPEGLSEILCDYTKRTREITKELLRAIMEGIELEEDDIEMLLKQKSGAQIFSANLYPPCPQPELAIGLPPHTDNGLLTILVQNDVGGLQIKNKGIWVDVDPIPNSIMVITGYHMEVLSKGKYKSVIHRAVVNNKETRVSLVMTSGPPNKSNVPSSDSVVSV